MKIYDLMKNCLPSDHSNQVNSRYYIEQIAKIYQKKFTVLDLGAGNGWSHDEFLKNNDKTNWIGLDIEDSPEVRSRTRNDITFYSYDGINIPLEDKKIDVCFSHQVFEHVRYPEKLLTEIHRTLKPQGFFIGSVSSLEPYHSFSYWNFTLYGFKTILEDNGFQVIELRPGIDGISLITRSFMDNSPLFNSWFGNESLLNQTINNEYIGQENHKAINFRKLCYCGHLCFKAIRL